MKEKKELVEEYFAEENGDEIDYSEKIDEEDFDNGEEEGEAEASVSSGASDETERKKVCVVIAKLNDQYEMTLDRIITQANFDLKDAEVIIEDSSDAPIPGDVLEKYRKTVSVSYEVIPGADLAALYNAGLEKVTAETVNFLTTNVFYSSSNVFVHGSKSEGDRTVVLNVGYHDRDTNVRTPYIMQPKAPRSFNLQKEPHAVPMNLHGYFFNTDLISEMRFSSEYHDECDMKFILDFLRGNYKFYYRHNSKITSYEPFENNTSKCAIQYKPWWYVESLENYYNELKDCKELPVYFQEAIMYLVFAKINCNLQDRSKGVVAKEDYPELAERMFRVVSCLDDNVILQLKDDGEGNRFKHQFKMPRWIKTYLLKNKYRTLGLELNEYITNEKLFYTAYKDEFRVAKTFVANLKDEKVTVYAINQKDGKLYFDCSTTVVDYLDEDSFELYALIKSRKEDVEDRRIEVKPSGIYPLMKIFGKTIAKRCRFIIELDLAEVDYKERLCVYASYAGREIKHNFAFSSVYSRLSDFKNSFWHVDNFLLVNKKDCIFFEQATTKQIIKHEINFDKARLREVKGKLRTSLGIKTVVLILFRWLYYFTRPIYKNKHIWITWDKLYKAGDNGEYMYQYCRENKKANVYYMIKKDSPDYERLMAQDRNHVLVFKSFKARFIALHAEVVLNTHANIVSSCGFDFMATPYVSGLFNPEVICIQHGLTIQRIAQFQNRLFDNIKLYCCASPMEVENILGDMYGYAPENVKLTGLARYDGLKSNDKKIILITPTWRRNVVNSSVAHIKKSHNDNFKNSDYFQIYNSLINNKELIDCANKTGYKIIYLLHPAMSGQLEDFDKNEFVDIIPATGDINYEKILTESSLMVTDYSGVQFDFAYQRKPLVYYHPDRLPPHYDTGLLDYETMAFGPVCKNEEQIVSELCDYMRTSCVIKEEYKKRGDRFFAFDDFGSCERIYNEIISYLKEIKRI